MKRGAVDKKTLFLCFDYCRCLVGGGGHDGRAYRRPGGQDREAPQASGERAVVRSGEKNQKNVTLAVVTLQRLLCWLGVVACARHLHDDGVAVTITASQYVIAVSQYTECNSSGARFWSVFRGSVAEVPLPLGGKSLLQKSVFSVPEDVAGSS